MVFSRASQPAGGERRGSVGHLLCVALRLSDDETPTEPLNLCIADELAPLRLTHHPILQPGGVLS